MEKVNFIVGDCFSAFAKRDNIITWSDFTKLKAVEIQKVRKSNTYFLGQGIPLAEVGKIKDANPVLYELIENPWVLNKDPGIAHKYKLENCHINVPTRISNENYSMDVLIDPDCCELSDHITGEHINGMVVIEAARQAFIGVTEAFFLTKHDNFYFVLSNMNCNFTRFLFPIPIKIYYKVLHYERHAKKGEVQVDFKVEAHFIQIPNNIACVISGEFSLYQKEMMTQVEMRRAAESIEQFSVCEVL